MFILRLSGRAILPAIIFASALQPASAAATDYGFELVGNAAPSGGMDVVRVRLVHLPDDKAVPNAVIFESKADMGPAGMASMGAPVTATRADGGVYEFTIQPGMTGTWALHLAAKVQGEPDTVRKTLDVKLVK